MMSELLNAPAWLSEHAPTLWSILNGRAQLDLPSGLREYLAGTPRQVHTGQVFLTAAERHLSTLAACCGLPAVQHAYRRDLSAVRDEQRLAELLCEVATLSRLAKVADLTTLQPRSHTGSKSDGEFLIDEHRVFVEVKRYHDNWLREDPTEGSASKVVHRSVIPAAPESVPPNTERPRSMDLVSKLARVPLQFPQGGVNLLVIFHSSIGDSWRYIQQAFFGGEAALHELPDLSLAGDGLFATEAWNAVHGVTLFQMPLARGPFARGLWVNPRSTGVPEAVSDAIRRLTE